MDEVSTALRALSQAAILALISAAIATLKIGAPLLRQVLIEWLTTRAFARWTVVASGAAAEIADPANPAVSVAAKAEEMLRNLPDAAATLNATQEAAERAINRALSALKLSPPAVPSAVLSRTEASQ